jgi:hypothetical protein
LVDVVVDSPEVFLKEKFGKEIKLQMKKPDWREKLGFGTDFIENTLSDDTTVEDELLEYCSIQALAEIPNLRL